MRTTSDVTGMSDLRNCGVLITGGASGIGRATANLLVRRGARVVVADYDEAAIEQTVVELSKLDGPRASGIGCDIRHAEAVEQMVDEAEARLGQIDALVHSAGILRPRGVRPRPLHEVDDDEFEAVVGTNLHGAFFVNRAVLAKMVPRRAGQIINIASTSGRKGRAFDSVYSASKAGLIGLSEAAAEEARPHGIRVQLVLPDAIATPLWQQNGPVPLPPGALPPERVAGAIALCLSLPADATCEQLVISPLSTRKLRGKAPTGSS